VIYEGLRKRCSEKPVGKNNDVVKSMHRHCAKEVVVHREYKSAEQRRDGCCC
jgi:hypothetical protein